jgi:hypothetical protein
MWPTRHDRTVMVSRSARSEGNLMTMRRTRVVPLEVAEDGTLDLPDGASIISLEFESEGAYGYGSRPVRAWVDVPADAS